MRHITGFSLTQIKAVLSDMHQPSYRYTQLLYWVYKKRVDAFNAMTNTPKDFRTSLAQRFDAEKLRVRYRLESSGLDAVKFGFEIPDFTDVVMESVLLFDDKRRTLCISSQLGCLLGCAFCATGALGFIRNLTQHEMIGQLVAANDYLESRNDKPVTNVVFMGMGEALLNFETMVNVIEIIMSQECFCIGGRRITVSTAGVVPAIHRFMTLPLNVGLAISLNSPCDEIRTSLMPVNRQYPIAALMDCAKRWYQEKGDPVTFEYIVMAGINDSPEDARKLGTLLHHIPCKVNLIPYNPGFDEKFQAPDETGFNDFSRSLSNQGVQVTVRKSRGQDIRGACGQLAYRKKL